MNKRLIATACVGLLIAALPMSAAYSDVDPGIDPGVDLALCTAQPFGAGHGGIYGGPTLPGSVDFGATAECTGTSLDTLDAELWYSPSGINFYRYGINCSGPDRRVGTGIGETGPCGVSSLDEGYYGVSAIACSPSTCFESPMIIIATPVRH